uniref:Uncharacterized protein n=1 Tax=Ascaris lumbricoides TaxID=6252 RepID=A0A0M3IDG2_ASCLU
MFLSSAFGKRSGMMEFDDPRFLSSAFGKRNHLIGFDDPRFLSSAFGKRNHLIGFDDPRLASPVVVVEVSSKISDFESTDSMGSRKSSVAVESGAQPEIHAAVRLYRGAQFVGLVQNLSQDVGPNSRLTELAPDADRGGRGPEVLELGAEMETHSGPFKLFSSSYGKRALFELQKKYDAAFDDPRLFSSSYGKRALFELQKKYDAAFDDPRNKAYFSVHWGRLFSYDSRNSSLFSSSLEMLDKQAKYRQENASRLLV